MPTSFDLEPYANATEMRNYLPNTANIGKDTDASWTKMLTNASDTIRKALIAGFEDAWFHLGETAPDAASRSVWGAYRGFMKLPPFEPGTLGAITDSLGVPVSALTYEVVGAPYHQRVQFLNNNEWGATPLLWSGEYRVTASWTYGRVPKSINELCLELAVNIRQSSERGMFSDQIGVDQGGATTVVGRLDSLQRAIIERFIDAWRKEARYE